MSSMEVWSALGARGRRYPTAFSDTADARQPIEVEYGKGSMIPHLPQFGEPLPPIERWALEKIHPQFVGFDTDALARRIELLRENGTEVLVVYGIRRPLDAMWSMSEYKSRQPEWYAGLDHADIPNWIRRSLAALVRLRARVGGPVVDFADLPDGDGLRQLAAVLSPAWSDDEIGHWLRFAGAETDPQQRSKMTHTPFIGTRDPTRSITGPGGIWTAVQSEIERADAEYAELLGPRQPTGSRPKSR